MKWKKYLLERAVEKYSINAGEVLPVVPSPSHTHYRHRVEFSFSARRWYYAHEGCIENPSERLAMGFHPADNPFKVFDVRECYLIPEVALNIAKEIRKFTADKGFSYFDPKENRGLLRSLIIRITTKGELMAIVVFAEDQPKMIELLMKFICDRFQEVTSLYHVITPEIRQNFSDGKLVLYPGTNSFIEEQCNHLVFKISPRSFYQPNLRQAEHIFRIIAETAELRGDESVVDLYCGIGTISLHLAGRVRRVTGIEGSPDAVEDALNNARINNIVNAEFICGDILETFNLDFLREHGNPDMVILDPPRSGTLIEIKKTILAAAPRKIIYLSCDPLSLARDLKMLTQGYEITSIRPFDQFPHTHQLETLVLLQKKSQDI